MKPIPAFWISLFVFLLFASTAIAADPPPPRKHSNLDRLSLERFAAVHADVEKLKPQRIEIPALPGLNDYRCILHAHAEDSDHTGGTLNEMLADAKKAVVHAVLLTDHYRPPTDFIDGRWRGMKDGVLFIPGAEVNEFLAYPTKSILKRMAKRDKTSLLALALMLTDPKKLADLEKALRLYSDEVLAFQCDYPDLYMKKWDEGTKGMRLTGVAAFNSNGSGVPDLRRATRIPRG